MIELPEGICPRNATAYLLDFGGFPEGVNGGKTIRINRKGNRHKISVNLPPIRNTEKGRVLVGRLLRAKTEGIRMDWPLQGFRGVPSGQAVVDGADQNGETLSLRNLTPQSVLREGQWISFERGDDMYLHHVTTETVADSLGNITIPISPPLRGFTIDGAKCHLERPIIQGYIKGEGWQWEMQLANFLDIHFEIEEMA